MISVNNNEELTQIVIHSTDQIIKDNKYQSQSQSKSGLIYKLIGVLLFIAVGTIAPFRFIPGYSSRKLSVLLPIQPVITMGIVCVWLLNKRTIYKEGVSDGDKGRPCKHTEDVEYVRGWDEGARRAEKRGWQDGSDWRKVLEQRNVSYVKGWRKGKSYACGKEDKERDKQKKFLSCNFQGVDKAEYERGYDTN